MDTLGIRTGHVCCICMALNGAWLDHGHWGHGRSRGVAFALRFLYIQYLSTQVLSLPGRTKCNKYNMGLVAQAGCISVISSMLPREDLYPTRGTCPAHSFTFKIMLATHQASSKVSCHLPCANLQCSKSSHQYEWEGCQAVSKFQRCWFEHRVCHETCTCMSSASLFTSTSPCQGQTQVRAAIFMPTQANQAQDESRPLNPQHFKPASFSAACPNHRPGIDGKLGQESAKRVASSTKRVLGAQRDSKPSECSAFVVQTALIGPLVPPLVLSNRDQGTIR